MDEDRYYSEDGPAFEEHQRQEAMSANDSPASGALTDAEIEREAHQPTTHNAREFTAGARWARDRLLATIDARDRVIAALQEHLGKCTCVCKHISDANAALAAARQEAERLV